jgi:hypothetical protein
MASAKASAELVDPARAKPRPSLKTAGRSKSARAAGQAFFKAGARAAENAQANSQPTFSVQQLQAMLVHAQSQQPAAGLAAAQTSPGLRQAALGAALEEAAGANVTDTRDMGPDGVWEGKHGQDLLPPRSLDKQQDARLMGGAARIPSRLAAVGRSFLDTNEIEQSEFAKLGQGLNMGSQVPHTSTRIASLVGWGVGSESQSSPLLSALQQGGLARRDGSGAEALLGGIFSELQSRATKDTEKAVQPAIKDFAAFYSKLMKLKVLAPALVYTDPQAYWAMDRHLKSVLLVTTQHGWPVAADYHMREMQLWASGHHDTTLYTESPEYQSGHFEAALSRDSLYMALLTVTDRPKAPNANLRGERKTTTRSASYTPNGTVDKVNATDTYCGHHKLYYAVALNHSDATCRAKGGKGRG